MNSNAITTTQNTSETGLGVLELIPIGYLWLHIVLLNLAITISILTKSEKTYLNVIYLSIASSDLLTGLICVTFEIFYKRFSTPLLDDVMCLANSFFEYAGVCIALFSLLLLTVHRYRRLTCPAGEKESMTQARYVYVLLIWVGNMLVWVVVYLVLDHFVLNASMCDVNFGFGLVLGLDLALQICPIAALFVFNGLIFKHLIAKIQNYRNLKIKHMIIMKRNRYPKKLNKGRLRLERSLIRFP